MSGKIYNKNLTFLQDQPFAENLLNGFFYKKRRAKLSLTRDSSLPTHLFKSDSQSIVGTHSFGSSRVRYKSEKMRKAETSLVKHFCLILERTEGVYTCESEQYLGRSGGSLVGNIIPHLLVSVDSMRNTLLATRTSRSPERVKPPSQFKKVLRESRKIRLLYGNLSRRHLSRASSKMRLPGENLLLWLESRLDVVLERCGFFGSVKAARQCVLNGKIKVNSKVVRSPGFILEGGDLIKVVQEKLLFESFKEQLSRGAVLSDEVLPRRVRNKSLVTALSRTLQKCNSALQLKPKASPSAGYNSRIIDSAAQSFASDSDHSPVLNLSPYRSFYTWLLKEKQNNYQPSEYLGRQGKALLSTELRFNKLPANPALPSYQNKLYSDKKVTTSSPSNWRFIGSPHLLFSFFFLHAHLQKVMFFVAQTLNKGLLVDKGFGNHKSYKTQNENKTSAHLSKSIRGCSDSCSTTNFRGDFSVPTISSVSKYCAVNTTAINTEYRISQPVKGTARQNLASPNQRVLPLVDVSKFEFLLNLISQSLQKNNKSGVSVNPKASRRFTLQNVSITDLHNSFWKEHVDVVTEVYYNLFSGPWFTCFYQDEFLLRNQEISQLVRSIVKKHERDLLCVLLSDLLLYSLFIKKECLSVQLKKQQVDLKSQAVSRLSPASVTPRKKQKAFDPQGSTHSGFSVGASRVFPDNSHLWKVDYKKINISEEFDISQAKRIKPLHLEVSYQSLCAVYLYPPQRVCLPVMVDVDSLVKAL